MATQKQIQTQRSNAQISTGPRTEQGKAILRRNAPKTGIHARNETAPGEAPAALAAEYGREFQPIGAVKRLLVDILSPDAWFLRRYRFLAADLVRRTSGVAYQADRGVDSSVTDSQGTENPQIGFVFQLTPGRVPTVGSTPAAIYCDFGL